MLTDRRAPVQGEGAWYLADGDKRKEGSKRPGTISWEEHEEAWRAYAERYGKEQSAERIAQRGGFGYFELQLLLKRDPQTWEPRER